MPAELTNFSQLLLCFAIQRTSLPALIPIHPFSSLLSSDTLQSSLGFSTIQPFFMSNSNPIPFLHDPHPSTEADLRHALLRATAELQSTRLAAQGELRRMEAQAIQLAQLLDTATRERDELRRQCHTLLLLLSSHPHPTSDATNSTEEDESSNGTSSSPVSAQVPKVVPAQDAKLEIAGLEEMAMKKGLPEKGKLVEAVVAAGPLLQTLLLAGPLPRWRHPPPPVRCFDIPLFAPGMELREAAESVPEKTFAGGLGSSAGFVVARE